MAGYDRENFATFARRVTNPAEQLSERLAEDQGAVAWLDLYEPTEADLQIVMEEFGLRGGCHQPAPAARG